MRLFYRIRYHPWVVGARNLVPHSWVNLLKHWPAAVLANGVYGWPSRKLVVIGVTGTDGKTTTATWLHHLLVQGGASAALVSTVAAKLGKRKIDTGLHVTAPDHFPLQRLLRQIVNQGFTHVVLEVTSHGLVQHRFGGVRFTGGVLTNVAEDHLDYHGSWKEYLAAKAKLFAHTKFAVLNAEDKSFRYLQAAVSGKIIPYGLKRGKVTLRDWQEFFPPLPAYNQANLLAAVAAARELGVETSFIRQAVRDLPPIRGRLEVMQSQPFLVVVDFAHTPHGLEQVLIGLRPKVKPEGKLIAVFGCAGQRDRTRRKMGQVAARLADITIITAEDPRTEGVKHISAEIARWARKGGAREVKPDALNQTGKRIFARIDDREAAIARAIELAQAGDVVGIFGKGHERSMAFGTTEYPWSDQKVVKTILRKGS
jgi:UDP-N-acetylmuramoyl-L-alanyl-D-glutamate--2,6-diaminopimelate ligase